MPCHSTAYNPCKLPLAHHHPQLAQICTQARAMDPSGGNTDATSSTDAANPAHAAHGEGRTGGGSGTLLDGGDAEWHQVLDRHFKPLLRSSETDDPDATVAAGTSAATSASAAAATAAAAAASTISPSTKAQPCYYVYVGGMLLEQGKGGQKDLDDLERPLTMDGDLEDEAVPHTGGEEGQRGSPLGGSPLGGSGGRRAGRDMKVTASRGGGDDWRGAVDGHRTEGGGGEADETKGDELEGAGAVAGQGAAFAADRRGVGGSGRSSPSPSPSLSPSPSPLPRAKAGAEESEATIGADSDPQAYVYAAGARAAAVTRAHEAAARRYARRVARCTAQLNSVIKLMVPVS